jgi:colicin import membrane protein
MKVYWKGDFVMKKEILMSLDSTLPKDPLQATAILTALERKGENLCSYPTCHEPRQTTTGTGRPSTYCSNPKHNAVNSHRARNQLRQAAAALETKDDPSKKRDYSPAPITAESLRGSVLNRIQLLKGDLELYVTILTEMSDPDVSAAQIRATLDQANAHVAEAQQNLSNEQALRLKAEADLLAAQQEAQSEREAAEQAITQMEEAETNAQRQTEEAQQRIKEIQDERDSTVEQVRAEAERRIQEIEKQMSSALAQAQAETTKAQEEARQANISTLEARAQTTTAERLVREANTNLERERAEVDRLRKELTETIAEARRRAEVDRAEAERVLERERSEVTRLREELTATRKQAEQAALLATNRADKLVALSDELRAQLVQAQTKGKE